MIVLDVLGQPADAQIALPADGQPGPGVLVLHAWWGLTPTMANVCDRLAAEGFVALAPDLFGGRTADTPADAEALVERADPAAVLATVDAALGTLARHPAVGRPRVGVVGFSFGAAFAVRSSVADPDRVAAVAVYYGTPGSLDLRASRAVYLGHFARGDPFEPDEAVDELTAAMAAAGRDFTLHRYDARHWFAEADRPEYQPADADLAWRRTVEFLRRQL